MWGGVPVFTRNFGYFFHEGWLNIFRHRAMSFASAGITAVCLLLMGTFTLIALHIDANLSILEASNEILAFVDENYSREQALELEKKLSAIPNINSVRFITREQALENFIKNHPDEELFQDLEPEIFRDRYALRIGNLENLSETADRIADVTGIDGVNLHEEFTGGLITLRRAATILCAVLTGVLFAASLFIIANTIRLTTFDRREEIAVMRIVGATNGFIRWPFVCEGFLIGLFGALAGFFTQWATYCMAVSWISESDRMRIFEIIPFREVWLPVAGVFLAAGLLTGIGGSLFGIRRFLDF